MSVGIGWAKDLGVEFIAQNDHVFEALVDSVLNGIPVVSNLGFTEEVESPTVDHASAAADGIRPEENRSPEDALERCHQPAIFLAALRHSEGIQHLSGRSETNGLALLADGQRG